MKKRKLNKDILKSILHSKGRFFSIMLLMALGSFALVGLFVAGPDMRATTITYFEENNTADITILSDYGIDESEQEYIEKASGIKDLEYIYLKDVTVENTSTSFRIFSKPEIVSLYELKDGRLPEADNEIAIDYFYKDEYKIGDTMSFTEKLDSEDSEPVLKIHEFTIVGYVYSPDILSGINRGQTTVGTGELNSYAVVCKDVFNSDVYMMAKITFEDTAGVNPYTDGYTNLIQAHKEELENLLSEQKDIRLSSIKEEYQIQIDNAKIQVDDAKQQLEDARTELSNAESQILEAENEISENEKLLNKAKIQIANAENQISSSESTLATKQAEYDSALSTYNQNLTEYNAGLSTLNTSKSELEAAKAQLASSQKEVNNNKLALETAKAQYESGISSLTNAISNLTNLINNSTLSLEDLAIYQAQLDAYKVQLSQLTSEYNTFLSSTYNPCISSINEAQATIDAKTQELALLEAKIAESEATLATAKSQLDSAYSGLVSAKAQLDAGYSNLSIAKSQLASSKAEYNENVQKLNEAKSELEAKKQEYENAKLEFEEKESGALEEIDIAEQEIENALKTLDDLNLPTYSVDTRRETPGSEGYKTYGTVAEIIDSLAKIFPVFLYFVAALVTFTTMTRFVTEERINSGTLKALGYSDNDIIKKFVVYGFIAGTFGTIIGVALGHTLLPTIVYNAYKQGFTAPQIELHFYPVVTICAIILSFCSSVLPAFTAAKKGLQETPASLLLPKSPKAGTKILLEKITPLWNKMSFTHKVTARNIFRYKSRMFMTIFGIAGATAILFTGLSVQGSISEINQRQFSEIIKYDIIQVANDNLSTEETSELSSLLSSSEIKDYSAIYYESASVTAGKNNDTEDVRIIVPENIDSFSDYIYLVNRESQKHLELEDDGAVVSERLAEVFGLKVGDYLTYTDASGNSRTVKISGICEMYTGHFIFMNSTEYENVYGETYKTNSNLILLNNNSSENTENIASSFMELTATKGVVSNVAMENKIQTIVNALNTIMEALIIVSAMLAIVIIYNLTNINVTERIRELCTIKVLGFRDNEVTMYIYRETLVLTLVAIIFGWLIGIGLHSYILEIVPPDEVMFNPAIVISSFIIPFIVIFAISLLLKIFVNHKLKYIDMLDALKSVD